MQTSAVAEAYEAVTRSGVHDGDGRWPKLCLEERIWPGMRQTPQGD